MLILRLIHILFGVFWAGTAFFFISFMTPAIQKTGDNGAAVMRQLITGSSFTTTILVSGTLNVVSGVIMFFIVSGGFNPAWLATSTGVVLTIGGISGLLAITSGFFLQGLPAYRIRAIASDIAGQGGPPTPEQGAEMQQQQTKAATGGRVTALLLLIALIGMAAQQAV